MMDNKQAQIIRSAQRLFLKHGYLKVSMSDIAEELEISRPTLYKSFANKEAVLDGLLTLHAEECRAEVQLRLPKARTFPKKLQTIFDIWVIEPFAMAIGNENGRDLMLNGSTYYPLVFERTYQLIQDELQSVIEGEVDSKSLIPVRDLSQLLSLSVKGLKASAQTEEDLRRLVKGLIVMTTAVIEKRG